MKKISVYCKSYGVTYENTYGEDGPYTGYHHDGYENHQVNFSGDYGNFEESYETDLDDPYFVYVLYSSGGTFGRTDGIFKAIGIYSREEAEKVKILIEKCVEPRHYNRDPDDLKQYKETKKELDKLGIYDCWNGYFESLEGAYIKKVEV